MYTTVFDGTELADWFKAFFLQKFDRYVKTHDRAKCYELIRTTWVNLFRKRFMDWMLEHTERSPEQWRKVCFSAYYVLCHG